MVVSFLESIKFVGHQYPVAFLRIYTGYYFLDQALTRWQGDFLKYPRLSAIIMESLPQTDLPNWYANFLQYVVVPHWEFFAYFITYCEFLIGFSLLLGFLVRPICLVGIFLMFNFVFAGQSIGVELQKTYLVLFIVLFWIGAGRCLGFDYYFYKRYRGMWW